VRAHVSGHVDGWTLLRLAQPLPAAEAAPSPVFAGSPVATTEFMACDAAEVAWPVLRQGFAGRVPVQGPRALGIELPPGPRGGPVFDRAGRLAGEASLDAIYETARQDLSLQPVRVRSHLDRRKAAVDGIRHRVEAAAAVLDMAGVVAFIWIVEGRFIVGSGCGFG